MRPLWGGNAEGLGRGLEGQKQWGPRGRWLLFSGGPLGCSRTCPGALATDAALTLPVALPLEAPLVAPLPTPAERLAPGEQAPPAQGQLPCWSRGGWGEGPVHSGRFHKRPPAMWGRRGPPGVGAQLGLPEGPREGGGGTAPSTEQPRTQTALHMIREHRAHCVVDLKVLTKRNYGKYKSEKLDQDAEPRTARYSRGELSGAAPPGRRCGRGRGAGGSARVQGRAQRAPAHTCTPTRMQCAPNPTRPPRTLDCAREVCMHACAPLQHTRSVPPHPQSLGCVR